jgi:glycosyltransferase (activator-dependent family)
MRVLFATYAEKTHFQPMVPLAWALRTAGHDVLVATQPELVGLVTGAGLPAVSVGPDNNLWRTANRFLTERVARTSPDTYRKVRAIRQPPFDVAGDPPESITYGYLLAGYTDIVPSWYRTVSDPMLDELVALSRSWRPDLVIWESATYAGPIAAAAVGAAHARLPCFLDMFGVIRQHFRRLLAEQPAAARRDPLGEWLAAHADRFGVGFTEDLTTGHFTVDQYPPSLRMEADLHYVGLRYVPYNGPSVLPGWLRAPPGAPRVCLTLGTTSTERYDGYAFDVQETLDALADLDIELVATLPPHRSYTLRHVPANTRVESFVPLHALIPSCSLVVHHAAFGTSNTTWLYGVPHLLLPERHDAPMLARALTRYGAGLTVPYGQVSGAVVREHVSRVLADPSFGARAAALRSEVLTMPTPNELVRQLPALVERYRYAHV